MATDAQPARAGGLPSQILASSPLLGVLAAIAAISDVLINRGAVRTLSDRLTHAELLDLSRWGHLPRNLAAVAGFVALSAALAAFLTAPRSGRISRGLGIAGFGGIFLPIVAVATILPPEFLARRWAYLMVFAVGAGNVLAILVSTTASRRVGPRGLRTAATLLAGACFLSFARMALMNLPIIAHTGIGVTMLNLVGRTAEVAWLAVPLAAAATILPRPQSRRAIIALSIGALTSLAILAFGVWARTTLRTDVPIVVYGMSGGELFTDALPFIYFLHLSAGVGIGVSALCMGETTVRQAGAALLLLMAAGFAPRAPLRLLVLALGAAMLARASLCLGERLVAARQRAEEEARERASLADLDESLSDPPSAPNEQ